MKISDAGRALVEAFEGCDKPVPGKPGYFHTYHDEVGVLTIGFGHTNLGNVPPHIAEGDVWSRAQCDAALANDMASFERDVLHIMGATPMNQSEFDALVSFDFNTGSLAKSSIPRKIKSGDKAAAMATLLQYNHAAGKVYAGLTRRRQAEKLLFEGKTAEALTLAGAHIASGDVTPKAAAPAPAPVPAPAPSTKPAPSIVERIRALIGV